MSGFSCNLEIFCSFCMKKTVKWCSVDDKYMSCDAKAMLYARKAML